VETKDKEIPQQEVSQKPGIEHKEGAAPTRGKKGERKI
jgi:hypothetical protein